MFSHLKIWHLLFLPPLLGLLLLIYVWLARTPAHPGQETNKRMTPFIGGAFEASGVASVSGADGVLFVDNGRKGKVFWMALDQNGRQVGAIKPVELGVDIEDIEGITTDGTYFYVVSSQSRPKAIASEGLVRFKFDARTQTITEVAAVSGLKNLLVQNVAELREDGDRKGKHGGLNIEGLAWDPRHDRLILGLRSPIVDAQALAVAIRLRDAHAAFSLDNLEVYSKAIRLSLGGVGIRSIEYDSQANLFRILSGAAEDQDQTEFGLWEWNGDEPQRVLRETTKFDKSLKPEGVARATVGKRNFLIVVFDAGGYTIVE